MENARSLNLPFIDIKEYWESLCILSPLLTNALKLS